MLNVPYRQPPLSRRTLEQASSDYDKIRRAYNGLYRKCEELGILDEV